MKELQIFHSGPEKLGWIRGGDSRAEPSTKLVGRVGWAQAEPLQRAYGQLSHLGRRYTVYLRNPVLRYFVNIVDPDREPLLNSRYSRKEIDVCRVQTAKPKFRQSRVFATIADRD